MSSGPDATSPETTSRDTACPEPETPRGETADGGGPDAAGNAEAAVFVLPQRCGASATHELVAAGLKLGAGGRMEIDASAVVRMSCAAVVALISLVESTGSAGGGVVIRAPAAAFTDAFADLGLFEALMKMEFAA